MNSSHHDEILRRIEILIARVLFIGALIAIVVAAAGILMYAAKGGLSSAGPSLQDQLRRQTGDQTAVFVSLSQIADSLKNGNPLAITEAGLMLLLLVPVITVALLIPAFFKESDFRYSAIAAIVLMILLFGLIHRG